LETSTGVDRVTKSGEVDNMLGADIPDKGDATVDGGSNG
jgi:hypothetical protein